MSLFVFAWYGIHIAGWATLLTQNPLAMLICFLELYTNAYYQTHRHSTNRVKSLLSNLLLKTTQVVIRLPHLISSHSFFQCPWRSKVKWSERLTQTNQLGFACFITTSYIHLILCIFSTFISHNTIQKVLPYPSPSSSHKNSNLSFCWLLIQISQFLPSSNKYIPFIPRNSQALHSSYYAIILRSFVPSHSFNLVISASIKYTQDDSHDYDISKFMYWIFLYWMIFWTFQLSLCQLNNRPSEWRNLIYEQVKTLGSK